MPEGDTILHAARRVGGALLGKEILAIETPQPRHLHDRWPERLAGRAVRSVDSHGKHLFVRFDGDATLHSHLRMGASGPSTGTASGGGAHLTAPGSSCARPSTRWSSSTGRCWS
ncbi:MAG: DNA-formamidopyrimidine glycosylase family protein [Pseudonocardiaceae bacterium]